MMYLASEQVMSHVATPSGLRDADPERPGSGNPNELHAVEMTVQCEQAMDAESGRPCARRYIAFYQSTFRPVLCHGVYGNAAPGMG